MFWLKSKGLKKSGGDNSSGLLNRGECSLEDVMSIAFEDV